MADKTSKAKSKRLSKGGRTHVRRLKQAARKIGAVPNLPARRLSKMPKKKDSA
jgi:hypothetical protein